MFSDNNDSKYDEYWMFSTDDEEDTPTGMTDSVTSSSVDANHPVTVRRSPNHLSFWLNVMKSDSVDMVLARQHDLPQTNTPIPVTTNSIPANTRIVAAASNTNPTKAASNTIPTNTSTLPLPTSTSPVTTTVFPVSTEDTKVIKTTAPNRPQCISVSKELFPPQSVNPKDVVYTSSSDISPKPIAFPVVRRGRKPLTVQYPQLAPVVHEYIQQNKKASLMDIRQHVIMNVPGLKTISKTTLSRIVRGTR